ncbi:uncharacterized protein K02A2.6-like [Lineus longissimus]|uniref:uncharacterized protein K02A2.6-like n=1 Tax=Lineus longissimus TaxID=88925 RepID=UPI00315C7A76
MSAEIRSFVETCDTCATFADKQPPETLNLHDVPDRPWSKVASDLFSFKGKNYLVTVDYFSSFFELDYLHDITADTVIAKMKMHFARHGIPDILVSDRGTQFTSDQFRRFSTNWSFTHEFISPGNSKANGAVEAAVKVAQKLLTKSKAAKENPYLGLLNIRNTPTEGLQSSPSQRLLGRRTKTLIPSTQDRLLPRLPSGEKERMENRKLNMAQKRNGGRHDLKPLKPGDHVRIQPTQFGQTEWRPATVAKRLKSRTNEVTALGKTLVRNRQQLRFKPSLPTATATSLESTPVRPSPKPNSDDSNTEKLNNEQLDAEIMTSNDRSMVSSAASDTPAKANTEQSVTQTPAIRTTRSGRVIKPVDRLEL